MNKPFTNLMLGFDFTTKYQTGNWRQLLFEIVARKQTTYQFYTFD